jgi:hypothetical protein
VRVVRRILLTLLTVHIVLALISGYRAIVQVYAMELRVPASDTLRAGSTVGMHIKTSGRAQATARLMLVQGSREETIGVRHVRGNIDGAYIPFPVRESLFVTVPAEVLARFEPGPATIRATGTGTKQWMRLPPPTVRERVLVLAR